MKILLSAFACDPTKGSEAANGWNWAAGLAALGYEVHCITRAASASGIRSVSTLPNLTIHYVQLPGKWEKLYNGSTALMYLYYMLWQYAAYRKAKKLNRKHAFQLVHHVTWGSIQLGSFLYRLPVPFIFGPAGGGQQAPANFQSYFQEFWSSEVKRSRVSSMLQKINPAFRKMVKKSSCVLVANKDTYELVSSMREKDTYRTFDFALPASFFPASIAFSKDISREFKLLWVGRFMPRKGLLLVLEVMRLLKENTTIKLTIVGDGALRSRLQEYAREHELFNVSFKGSVSHQEVKALYASHDAFFFTSLRDSCPVQVLEAMAFGLPVITLDLHGQAEIVSEHTGIRVPVLEPAQTVDTLAKEIISLEKDLHRFNKMRHAAFAFAREHTWDSKIKTLTEKYYPKQ